MHSVLKNNVWGAVLENKQLTFNDGHSILTIVLRWEILYLGWLS